MKIRNCIKTLSILALFLVVYFISVDTASAQGCVMCRSAIASNMASGGIEGNSLNMAVMYMMATPYLLVGVIGFLWWKNRKRGRDEES